MPTRNIYRTKLNEEIHQFVAESSVESIDDIKKLLSSRYTDNQISNYLDFRYQEDYLSKLNYPGGKTPKWFNYFVIVFGGTVILWIHYHLNEYLDFERGHKILEQHATHRDLGFTVTYAIIHYSTLVTGILMIGMPLTHGLVKIIRRKDE